MSKCACMRERGGAVQSAGGSLTDSSSPSHRGQSSVLGDRGTHQHNHLSSRVSRSAVLRAFACSWFWFVCVLKCVCVCVCACGFFECVCA